MKTQRIPQTGAIYKTRNCKKSYQNGRLVKILGPAPAEYGCGSDTYIAEPLDAAKQTGILACNLLLGAQNLSLFNIKKHQGSFGL